MFTSLAVPRQCRCRYRELPSLDEPFSSAASFTTRRIVWNRARLQRCIGFSTAPRSGSDSGPDLFGSSSSSTHALSTPSTKLYSICMFGWSGADPDGVSCSGCISFLFWHTSRNRFSPKCTVLWRRRREFSDAADSDLVSLEPFEPDPDADADRFFDDLKDERGSEQRLSSRDNRPAPRRAGWQGGGAAGA
uniref:Uncharacterized protein n=1 Tax=Anopheles coluzzii TaxID=1518534 RepID=A0A8W7PX78_ANOCL